MNCWPQWLDNAGIMAKSADQSHGTAQQTLSEHTYQVLERLADQVRLRPALPALLGDPYLWDRLYWGCLLHDFGKAAAGFQERLKPSAPDNEWKQHKHRHEALSLGFVDWLFPSGHPDRAHVIAVIIAHHKDGQRILEQYGAYRDFRDLEPEEKQECRALLAYLDAQISLEIRQHLWRWVSECGTAWASQLGIPLTRLPDLLAWDAAAQTPLAKSLHKAMREFQQWRSDLPREAQTHIHVYRGLILTSDHAASAGAGAFPDFRLSARAALRPLARRRQRTMTHQRDAANTSEGSALLVAPTGAGKTEAALLWAARQTTLRPTSRLFYTLPYQASMNAAAKRLSEEIFGRIFDEHQQVVTLKHSRATLRFYQDRMEIDDDSRAAKRVALERANKTGLNYFPVQVFSPYQMLKAAYALKGYETFLVDYAGALFIFDEIHAYHPLRMALIIPFMRWLAQHFGARFLIMTATLPPMLVDLLAEALPGLQSITADQQTFSDSRRHEVELRDGNVFDCAAEIVARYQAGESVLVCCNTVGRAQSMYDLLAQFIPKWQADDDDGDLCLLHSRFHLKDRTAKENWLFRRVGVGQHRGAHRPATVVVATQVVEVSLNVDFDTLYTDPAPLEALLQRFGRVNRGRGRDAELRPVHVCRAPVGEAESEPYAHRLVARALEVLPAGVIDEQGVSDLLKLIYTGELRDEWLRDYRKGERDFLHVLETMEPFESASEKRERDFYSTFDGEQVLPATCADDYEAAFARAGRLAASEYLVSVSSGQYWRQRQLNRLRLYDEEGGNWLWIAELPYDAEYGLRFDVQPGEDDA